MYLFYCDESNLEQRDNEFFVYGGILIPSENAKSLSQTIDELRADIRVPPDFQLKFNPGPAHLSHNQFIELKQTVIQASIEHGCKLIISLISHNIATSPDEARRMEINRVCYHFDCMLNRNESHGLVLIDRFNDGQIDAHLREKFSTGLTGLPYSPTMRLENIIGYHYSAIGQAHFSSIVDITLGSFRFALNAHTRQQAQHLESAQAILGLLSPLFYRPYENEEISELSLSFSPKVIHAPRYLEQYQGVKDFLAGSGIEAKQLITNQRRY